MRLHSAWHLLYDRLAWMFDFVSDWVSDGKWRAWGRCSLSHLRQGRVLELAHGPGHLLLALERAGRRPVGIDRSAQMGGQAARRLRRAGVAAALVRCDAQALPFRTGSFDEVVATFPTDEILNFRTIDEVARVTSARGRLVVVAGAQLDGDRPDPHFRHWLSTMAGEEGAWPARQESLFERAGFRARVECCSVDSSTVFLVVADKVGEAVAALAAEVERDLRHTARPAPRVPQERTPVSARRFVRKHLV
jgi:ubiquinone/menaquinone biosynthesis C-methylase UbiE